MRVFRVCRFATTRHSAPPRIVLAFTAILVSWASSANACGGCAELIMWRLFPPILTWAWIGIAWFLLLSLLATIWKIKIRFIPHEIRFIPHEIRFIPHVVLGVILVLLGWIASSKMGPISTLPFLVFAILASISVLLNKSESYSARFTVLVRSLTLLSLAAIATTGIIEIISPAPGSHVYVMLRWGTTGAAMREFSELIKAEPDSINSYREIVKKAKFFTLSKVVGRLAIVGDPTIDVPLIIEALDRSRADSDEYGAKSIEDSLRQMAGLSLSDETPTDEWRDKWEDKKAKALERNDQ